MVVCGGGGVTTVCGDTGGEEVVMTIGDDCGGGGDVHHNATVSDECSTVAAASAAAPAVVSKASTTISDSNMDDQMMVDEEQDQTDHHKQFFCTTPMVTTSSNSNSLFASSSPPAPSSSSSPAALRSQSPPSLAEAGCVASPSVTQGGQHSEDSSLLRQYLPLLPDLDLHSAIMEAVALEPKFQPGLSLHTNPRSSIDISGRMRNGSCHVLRCLKVWYELPSDTFFLAVNSMDRFLTRMRAQPKHLSCIAVSAFHVACEEMSALSGVAAPSRDSVSVISQSKCTPGDVQRMEEIIRTKLELGMHLPDNARTSDEKDKRVPGLPHLPVTPLTMLKLVHAGHQQLLQQHFPHQYPQPVVPPLTPLVHKLEVVVCDTRSANYRASELALAVLRRELLQAADKDESMIAAHVACLQPLMSLCKVNSNSAILCDNLVDYLLNEYDCPDRFSDPDPEMSHRQRLVWKLSNRTLRQLRPTDKLKRHPRANKLATIREFTPDTPESIWRALHSGVDLKALEAQGAIIIDTCCESDESCEDDELDSSSAMDSSDAPPPAAPAGVAGEEVAAGQAHHRHQHRRYQECASDERSDAPASGESERPKEEVEENMETSEQEQDHEQQQQQQQQQHAESSLMRDGSVEGSEENGQASDDCTASAMDEVEKMDEETVLTPVAEVAAAAAAVEATSSEGGEQEAMSRGSKSKGGGSSSPHNSPDSYSQVTKKRREDLSPRVDSNNNSTSNSRRQTIPLLPPLAAAATTNSSSVHTSPFSKITLTPGPLLSSSSSPAVKNLSRMLEAAAAEPRSEAGYYGYHHKHLIGIVGIEGIDGDVMDEQAELGLVQAPRLPLRPHNSNTGGNSDGKRKKQRVKLQLVAHPRYDSPDSEMTAEPASLSTSEEDMESYEKEFPPLPLPRNYVQYQHQRPSSPHAPDALKKVAGGAASIMKKKKSDASPYATMTKAMRNMQATKITHK